MPDNDQNKKASDSRDELLRSALSVNLSKELPTKEEEVGHAFSVNFAIHIRDLIGEADQIIAENTKRAETTPGAQETPAASEEASQEQQPEYKDAEHTEEADSHAIKAQETGTRAADARIQTEAVKEEAETGKPEPETTTDREKTVEASKTEKMTDIGKPAEDNEEVPIRSGKGRSRAEAAQERMNGKVIPASFLRRHRKAIVNAASLVLVFGVGVFFLKEGGVLLGSGGKAQSAASGGVETTSAPANTEGEEATTSAAAPASAAPDAGVGSTGAEGEAPGAEIQQQAETQQTDASDQAAEANRHEEGNETAGTGTRSAGENSRTAETRAQSSGETGNSGSTRAAGTSRTGNSDTGSSGTTRSTGAAGSSRGAGNSGNTRTGGNAGGTRTTGNTGSTRAAGSAGNTGTGAGTPASQRQTASAGSTVSETTAAAHTQQSQSGTAETSAAGASGSENTVQLPNPITEVNGAEEFVKQLGFSLSVYPAAAERTDTAYSLISNETAQIRYYSATVDSQMVYRAEKKETLLAELPEQERKPGEAELGEDAWRLLSGIYDPFDESRTEFWTVKGENGAPDIPITVRIVESEGSSGALATWEKDGILYTLWAEDASRHRNEVGKEAKNLIAQAEGQSPSA